MLVADVLCVSNLLYSISWNYQILSTGDFYYVSGHTLCLSPYLG